MATIHRHYHHLNHDVYIVNLNDENDTKVTVTVTVTGSVVKNWIKSMLHFNGRRYRQKRLIVGLGVQWTTYAPYPPPPNTLQLCINHRCLIFHLTHAGDDDVPVILRKILVDNKIYFVGFSNYSDRKKLLAWNNLVMRRDPHDVRYWLRVRYNHPKIERESVRWIVKKYLGIKVEQRGEVKDSDWDREVLTEEQVIFACIDAYCAFLIARNLHIWNLNLQ